MEPDDWNNTSLRPRFFFLDVGAAVVLPLVIFHPRLWTLALVLMSFVLFFILERRGLLPMTLIRILLIRLGNLFRWPIYVTRRRYYRRRMENR